MIPMKLLSKQWIVDENNNIIISEGRKEILETIERTGSINQTAKIMKMSYKGVWSRIKATEEYLKGRIVDVASCAYSDSEITRPERKAPSGTSATRRFSTACWSSTRKRSSAS